jgi:hypothetical protein
MLGTSNSYVASTPRKDFQVILCIFDGPVGCMIVKFLNKVKDDSTFSPKTKSPSRAATGGTPPKQSHFFTKNLYSKTPNTSRPGSLGKKDARRERPKGEDGQVGTAYASCRIRPLPLTTLPKGYSWKRSTPS